MFNFFSKAKNTSLNVVSIVLNITTLVYLVSLFGFNHINKELISNAFTGLSIIVVILSLIAMVIAFVFYTSFKIAYKKIMDNIENLTKTINEIEKH